MKNKRLKKQMEEKLIMDMFHNQASIELSYISPIPKFAIRKNCSSAYNYNSAKKDMNTYSSDMPKIIKY